MNGGNDLFGAMRKFTVQAVDGLNGLIGQREVNADEYENEAASLLKTTPAAMQINVLDESGNFFDFVVRE